MFNPSIRVPTKTLEALGFHLLYNEDHIAEGWMCPRGIRLCEDTFHVFFQDCPPSMDRRPTFGQFWREVGEAYRRTGRRQERERITRFLEA